MLEILVINWKLVNNIILNKESFKGGITKMNKKFKFLFTFLALFISLFAFSNSVFAAESPIENQIKEEIEEYVSSGVLDSWHLKLYEDEGYQTYYWKRCHLGDDFDYFRAMTYQDAQSICSWYDNEMSQTWVYILENLDIEPEWLEPNKYLGLYWDSYWNNFPDVGYLYLIWTSH